MAENQHTIPIKAECAVPMITLESSVVDFGECFVRYPYKKTIKMFNESKLPAKFEIVPQVRAWILILIFSVRCSISVAPAHCLIPAYTGSSEYGTGNILS